MEGPQAFGRYRVTGTLGKGAMGEVYAAVDDVLGREVAVKTLHGGASGLAARLLDERFKQEARAIASLAHPGVVQVFDIDLRAEPPYLVMERVAGPSLKERLAERPLGDRELRALGIQIANALAAAHAAGVVHRDVKPANILVAGEGVYKLADFGVAHVPDSSLTMTGQFVGSPAYAPPEALMRGQLGPAGDVYGLGATLYQAAAGRWPRADATTGALFAPVPRLAELAPHVSPQVADAIDRAVAVEPEQRPSATELAAALARASTPVSAVHAAHAPLAAAPVATEFVASQHGVSTEHVASHHGAPSVTHHGVATGPIAYASPLSQVYAPAAGAVALPQPARARTPWQRWAVIGATLLVILLIAFTRRSPSPPASGAAGPPSAPGFPAQLPQEPGSPTRIRAEPPPLDNDWAAGDWDRVVGALQDGQFGEARALLEHFEATHGATEQTRSLATQLDALPREALEPRGRGWGKRKKFKD